MLMPSIFGDSFVDDLFGLPERSYTKSYASNGLMQTDIRETKDAYEVIMNLPGYKKEDVKGELKDGYLVISANTAQNHDEQDKEGKYIRKERYTGTCSRSFYVGDAISQEDIKAKFENGTLILQIPKEVPKKAEEAKFISIEG